MGSRFFTNEEENTLKNKINNLLQTDRNIEYLDFLIGYFRITGFDKISDNLSTIKHTRILVGINADKNTYDATQLIQKFSHEQVALHNEEPLDLLEYQNFDSMRTLIAQKKIEVRISANRDVHSKMYIMRSGKRENYTNDGMTYRGSLIVGSSNLTHNGLEGNTEINAELNQDRDVVEAVNVFERLWAESVELTEDDFDNYMTLKLKKPKEAETKKTNYNTIFYQSLIEYFDDIIDNSFDIHAEITLFNYQKDAVNSAIVKINRYHGAILGDVVGLGKTVIAVAILKKLNYNPLIIAPPATHNQWKDTLKKFNIQTYKIASYDKLPLDTNAEIIIIDESHKLKNNKSKRYENIQELCKFPFRKNVLLLSATLQNNSPEDIANQIYLFQDKNGSNLPNIIALDKFFTPYIRTYKSLKDETDKTKVQKELQKISSEIKSKILNPLLIRRTRTDIENFDMYKSDIESFPKLEKLNSLEYTLGTLSDNFIKTINYLEESLTYERFRILNNLNEEGKHKYRVNNPTISDNIFEDNDLSTLAKYAFIKRFESSFYAFNISIENAIQLLIKFIEDLENNSLYVGEHSSQVLKRDEKEQKYIYDGNGKIYYFRKTKTKKEKIYLKGIIFSKKDIKDPTEYINKLKQDLDYLEKIKAIWKENKKDPKFDIFLEKIKEVKKDKKIVIFTEYTDTLVYLEKQFHKHNIGKTLFITSENRKNSYEDIAQNFDANYEIQRDDYTIIVTTDTLAEGVNLHRSNRLINYDLPWNSTKLMQRMGRINRIGSKFDTIEVSNFKPVDESNKVIGLLQKSFLKLQSFHYTLGEDSKILFDEEIVESFGITKDTDEELIYLQKIRDFKQNFPEEFELLKKQKNNALMLSGESKALSFFKVGTVSYFYEKKNNNYMNIDFLSFIKSIEKQQIIKPIESNIDEAIEYHIHSMNTKEFTKNDFKSKLTTKERKAISLLKSWYQDDDFIAKELFLNIKELIDNKTSIKSVNTILALKDKKREEIVIELKKLTRKKEINIINTKDIETKIFIALKDKHENR